MGTSLSFHDAKIVPVPSGSPLLQNVLVLTESDEMSVLSPADSVGDVRPVDTAEV